MPLCRCSALGRSSTQRAEAAPGQEYTFATFTRPPPRDVQPAERCQRYAIQRFQDMQYNSHRMFRHVYQVQAGLSTVGECRIRSVCTGSACGSVTAEEQNLFQPFGAVEFREISICTALFLLVAAYITAVHSCSARLISVCTS